MTIQLKQPSALAKNITKKTKDRLTGLFLISADIINRKKRPAMPNALLYTEIFNYLQLAKYLIVLTICDV